MLTWMHTAALQDLIITRQPSSVCYLQGNDDKTTMLEQMCTINTSKAKTMFVFHLSKLVMPSQNLLRSVI